MTATKSRDSRPSGVSAEEAYAQEVGQRIVRSRKEAGLTQVELAELVGSSQRAMQGYENGERIPYRQMAEIARVVNRPMAWLLHGDQAILDQDDRLERMDEALRDLAKGIAENNRLIRNLVKKL